MYPILPQFEIWDRPASQSELGVPETQMKIICKYKLRPVCKSNTRIASRGVAVIRVQDDQSIHWLTAAADKVPGFEIGSQWVYVQRNNAAQLHDQKK